MSVTINRDDFAAAVAEYALASLHLYELAADLSTAASSIVAGWRGEGSDEFSELVNRSIVPMIQGLQIKIGEFAQKLGSGPDGGIDALDRFKATILELTAALNGDDAVVERSRLDASLERVYMWDEVRVPMMSAITNGQYYLNEASRAFGDAGASLARTSPALPVLNTLRFASMVARGNRAFETTREKYHQCETEQAAFAEVIAAAGNQVSTIGITSFERLFDDVHGKCLDLPAQGFLLGCPEELLSSEELAFVAQFKDRGMGCPDLEEKAIESVSGFTATGYFVSAFGLEGMVVAGLLDSDLANTTGSGRIDVQGYGKVTRLAKFLNILGWIFTLGGQRIGYESYLEETPELPSDWRESNASAVSFTSTISGFLFGALDKWLDAEVEYDGITCSRMDKICMLRYGFFGGAKEYERGF